jgi:glutaredoxin
MIRQSFLTVLLLASTCVNAQAYRWVDDKGRVQVGDKPPANARAVRKLEPKEAPAATETREQVPFELQRAQKDFPVTLYTAPSCKEPCDLARAALNKRGVPFAEVPVLTPETLEQVKAKSGTESVPVLLVGRSVVNAFEQTRYDGILDSAGYPKEGVLPARSQRAPALPAGYEPPLVAEPVKPDASASGKAGPYDTSGLPSNRSDKPGPYDSSKLPSNRPDKPGPYVTPGSAK